MLSCSAHADICCLHLQDLSWTSCVLQVAPNAAQCPWASAVFAFNTWGSSESQISHEFQPAWLMSCLIQRLNGVSAAFSHQLLGTEQVLMLDASRGAHAGRLRKPSTFRLLEGGRPNMMVSQQPP